MEKSTIIGLAGGIAAVGVGMALKGADPHSLINPAAFLIIFAGTAAALFNAFPMSKLKKFPALLKILFVGKPIMRKQEVLETFIDIAKLAKKEADGINADAIADIVEADIRQMEERHRAGAQIFAQAGMYAPTLGVLGAVIGLIAALGNLSDIDQLGHSIAAAFVATLLGIFTGYVCWHPFANKLKQISAEEAEIKKMILEGAVALQSGASTVIIESRLQAFIPPSERIAVNER